MSNVNDYRCPKDCPERSKTCHAECERHKKYRELNEQRKKLAWENGLDGQKPYLNKRR